MNSANDKLPEVGEVVVSQCGRSFTLLDIIGEGGYGRVFRASHKGSFWAFKAEKYSKTSLGRDVMVMKTASHNHSKHICELFDHGFVAMHYMYIVISLLGPDLHKLRHDQIRRRFTLGTAVRAASQTLKAIEEIHGCGFLSRDIKPSNFAIGRRELNQSHIIFIFDFDLARKYISRRSKLIPSRGMVGWRGTARYGSLNSHRKVDLGRNDDVESWFYMIVEFVSGALPWHDTRAAERDTVRAMKQAMRLDKRDEYLHSCPMEYDSFLTTIDALRFDSTPPYQWFHDTLNKIFLSHGLKDSMPYDWQTEDASLVSKVESPVRSPTLFSAKDDSDSSDSSDSSTSAKIVRP